MDKIKILIMAVLLALSLAFNPVAEAQLTTQTGEIKDLVMVSNTNVCGGDVVCRTVYKDCTAVAEDKDYTFTFTDKEAKAATTKITDATIKTVLDKGCKLITIEGKKSPFVDVDNMLCKNGICDPRFAWWNASYAFKQCYPVTLPSGSLTNYQVLFNITYRSAMQTDFDDVRWVVNDSNTTEISYWLANYTTGVSADFWVKLPLINSTPCMYYGNASVSTSSNGNTTMNTFDDFEDGDITTMTNWSTGYAEVGSCAYAVIDFEGSKVLRITASGTADCSKKAGSAMNRPFVIEGDFMEIANDGGDKYPVSLGEMEAATTWMLARFAPFDDDIDTASIIAGVFKGWVSLTTNSVPNMNQNAWYHAKVIRNESAMKTTVWLASGKSNQVMSNNGATSSADHDVNGSVLIAGSYGIVYYDNIFTHEYNLIAPTIGSSTNTSLNSILITISYPPSGSTQTPDVPFALNVSANDTVNTWWYNYNGTNTTFTPNTTLTLDAGTYSLVVWANDSINVTYNMTTTFTVIQPPTFIENCTADAMALCEDDGYFMGLFGPEWSSGTCSGDTLYLSRNCSTSWAVGNITYYCNWDKTTTKACANGCYDTLTYYGAGCGPTDYELFGIAVAVVFVFLGAVVLLRRWFK